MSGWGETGANLGLAPFLPLLRIQPLQLLPLAILNCRRSHEADPNVIFHLRRIRAAMANLVGRE